MGGFTLLLSFLRGFVFNLYESPKFLMSRGRDARAVEIIQRIARYNGRTCSLTVEMLESAGEIEVDGGKEVQMDTSVRAAVLRKLRKYSSSHVKSLFATKKIAYSTVVQIIIWGMP